MKIDIDTQGNVIILSIIGDLVASSASELKGKVSELIQKNFIRIIIKLDQVDFMDSTGLGAFISCMKMLKKQNGILVLTGATNEVATVFRLTKAYKMMDIVPSKGEALQVIQKWSES